MQEEKHHHCGCGEEHHHHEEHCGCERHHHEDHCGCGHHHHEHTADRIEHHNAIEFYTVANEFCLFIEQVEHYELNDVLSYLQKICPLLYLKGSMLPVLEIEDNEAGERFVTEEDYQTMYLSLKRRFEGFREFSVVDDLGEVRTMDLAEVFADIYQDLKDFVLLYGRENSAAKENALSAVQYYYETRWGGLMPYAMSVVHKQLFPQPTDEDYADFE